MEQQALDELFSLTYEELRRVAATVKRGDPSATLTPTALVNEAWLKLRKSPELQMTSPLHFKRIAARAMRQLLVDAARRRNAKKREMGAGSAVPAEDDLLIDGTSSAEELVVLDSALQELARLNPRQATIVEVRYFAGLDVAETAAALGFSEATVMRDWRAARAWLAHQLRGSD